MKNPFLEHGVYTISSESTTKAQYLALKSMINGIFMVSITLETVLFVIKLFKLTFLIQRPFWGHCFLTTILFRKQTLESKMSFKTFPFTLYEISSSSNRLEKSQKMLTWIRYETWVQYEKNT